MASHSGTRMRRTRGRPVLLLLAALLLLAIALAAPLAARAQDVLFDLSSVRSRPIHADLPKRFLAVAAEDFGGDGFPNTAQSVSLLALPPSNAYGCELPSLPTVTPGGSTAGLPIVLLVRRGGNCTFLEKALHAQAAQAYGLLVVASDDPVTHGAAFAMGAGNDTLAATATIPSAMVDFTTGDALIRACISQDDSLRKGPQVQISPLAPVVVRALQQSLFDWSFVCMMALATFVVMYAAYLAASEERHERAQRKAGLDASADARPPSVAGEGGVAPEYLTSVHAMGFIVGASVSLLVLFFFIRYLIYVLIALFCVASLQAVTHLGALWLRWLHPSNLRTFHFRLGRGGVLEAELSLYTLLSFAAGVVLVVTWLFQRNSSGAWVLQDLLGVALLLLLQQSLRLPNIQVSALLLLMAFVYDVFWVFLSGWFFDGRSVMITVAKGGETGEAVPMLLRLPRINDDDAALLAAASGGSASSGYSMLGLGDMALPGLLVSYLLRFDLSALPLEATWKQWARQSYFLLSSLGYVLGLGLTYVALMLSRSGQPALLYLVPTTLGLVVLVAHRRGELKDMWTGGQQSGAPSPQQVDSTGTSAGSARGSPSSGGLGRSSGGGGGGGGGLLPALSSPRSRSPRRTGPGGGTGGQYASVSSLLSAPSGVEDVDEFDLDVGGEETALAQEDKDMLENL